MTRIVQSRLLAIHKTLAAELPPDPSWPGGEWPVRHDFHPPYFEIVAGAILTQNTRWERAEGALLSMARAGLTSPESVLECSEACLQSSIRTAGFFRNKAATLQRLSRFLIQLNSSKSAPTRNELLLIRGVGPETADSILLYAFDQPEMIADAYTRRLLDRIGLVPEDGQYESVKKFLETNMPADPALFRRFHAAVVQLCKTACTRKPRCDRCPLAPSCSSSTQSLINDH